MVSYWPAKDHFSKWLSKIAPVRRHATLPRGLAIRRDAGRTEDQVKPARRAVDGAARDLAATAWNRHAAGHRARDLSLAALACVALTRLARVRSNGQGDDEGGNEQAFLHDHALGCS